MDHANLSPPESERRLLLVLAALSADASPEGKDLLRGKLWEHHRYLLAMLRFKTGDEDLAEDILQETYAAFLRRSGRPVFSSDRNLRNYLVSIALNKLRDHFRGRESPKRRIEFRRQEEAEAWVENLASQAERPEDSIARQEEESERRGMVALAMESIPESYRAILDLKFAQGLGNEEIGSRLALGLKAAESLLFRAKKAFAKEFMKLSLRANGSASGRVHIPEEGPDEN